MSSKIILKKRYTVDIFHKFVTNNGNNQNLHRDVVLIAVETVIKAHRGEHKGH